MRHPARRALLGLCLVLLLAWLALSLVLGLGKTLGERHAPVDYPPFDFATGSFDDYAQYSRAYLSATRSDGGDTAVLANLGPFLLEPGPECPRLPDGRHPQGIVLTHGLLDTPYSMRTLGEALRSNCMLVYGLLLPEHGSRPGALLDSRWEHWLEAEHWAAQRLGERVESLLLGGHSAGGTLSILESLRNPSVDGLVLFTPALGIADAAKYARFLTPLGALFPGAGWLEVKPDTALYRYESFAFRGVQETWELIGQTWLEERAMQRNLPTFAVLSLPDTTVDTQAALDYLARNTHPLSTTLLYTQQPVDVTDKVASVPGADREHGVLSTSHLGLMIPPGHPYYGRDGLYRNCTHYAADSMEYDACKAGERQWYGENTPDNLAQGIVERISFNPYYAGMIAALTRFLDNLASAAP
ncbi:MAG TPA: alpha/beta hydrolase [Hyphomicrobiales bacterium]|nr:alpha/beta hydrolase [Hyphomicrobiales bacterium]